jgi:hypothetical protein
LLTLVSMRCCGKKPPSAPSPAHCCTRSGRASLVRRLRARSVFLCDQVRQRHWLAQLLGPLDRAVGTTDDSSLA